MSAQTLDDPFYRQFRGTFSGIMSWAQLDTFWEVVRQAADRGWYIYAIGEAVPTQTSGGEQVRSFIAEIDALLHKEHREDYCGIVYTDSKTEPTMIKIFDPNNLGVSCGSSTNPPLPGWIMSLIPPSELQSRRILPEGRRRWWQKIWA